MPAVVLGLFVVVLSTLSASSADALKGVALVIGNGDYRHLTKLPNPENDAKAIEDLLGDLGFDVTASTDRDTKKLTRDLQRFAEDAGDADTAIIYYSGHGIEAAGENFLIPVDADVTSLDNAEGSLVPLSAILAELKSKVPLVIVLLDACRNSPFPQGATLKSTPTSPPAPISVTGLGLAEVRGATPLVSATRAANNSVGTVIAFAAEPGKVALDGQPGNNSPYAAALIRHFSTMGGTEFGTVMRMVTEEVYLKTGGKQRPWTNESLSRLLYFGEQPPEETGADGDIVRERRSLLLTIAALPDPERRSVERAAQAGGVPMDALYAMLRSLGDDTSSDPAKLEQALRSQTERLKGILAERQIVNETDGELLKLSAQAQQAIQEGALSTALKLHDRIKVRVASLSQSLDDTEAALRARHIEFAQAYARSAETYALDFNFRQGADDYHKAFEEVRRWDDRLAWQYRLGEMTMLNSHGGVRGDRGAIESALAMASDVLSLAGRLNDQNAVAQSQLTLGRTLVNTAQFDPTSGSLQKALSAFEATGAIYTRDTAPFEWANLQLESGNAMLSLGMREKSTRHLHDALDAYTTALQVLTREAYPISWAWVQANIGNAEAMIGVRGSGKPALERALEAYRASLSMTDRDRDPLVWSYVEGTYAFTLGRLGRLTAGREYLDESVAAYRSVLSTLRREQVPLAWAETKSRLAEALTFLGERTGDPATLAEAYDAFTEALEEQTRERQPFNWAATLGNRATVLTMQGEQAGDAALLEKAIADYENAMTVLNQPVAPVEWATVQTKLGRALGALAKLRKDRSFAVRAVQAHLNAIEIYDPQSLPFNRADAQHNLGMVVLDLAEDEPSGPWIDYALNAFEGARTLQSPDAAPQLWAESTRLLAMAKILDGERKHDGKTLREAAGLLAASKQYFAANGFHKYDAFYTEALSRAQPRQ